jgi:hypothetical protein
MDKRKRNVTLCWVPEHAGITGNEEADEEAKQALAESVLNDEMYPPEDLSGWIKTEMAGNRTKKLGRGEECKEREKQNICWQIDTEKLKRSGDKIENWLQ